MWQPGLKDVVESNVLPNVPHDYEANIGARLLSAYTVYIFCSQLFDFIRIDIIKVKVKK